MGFGERNGKGMKVGERQGRRSEKERRGRTVRRRIEAR